MAKEERPGKISETELDSVSGGKLADLEIKPALTPDDQIGIRATGERFVGKTGIRVPAKTGIRVTKR